MPEAVGDNQLVVPERFVALFVPLGRTKPTEPWPVILQRYELCDDLAQALEERARQLHWELGVTEADVLERIRAGLDQPGGAGLSGPEVLWVVGRLAELLGWPVPDWVNNAPVPEGPTA